VNWRHIDEILDERRIIITCGTGGVGKTTLSAAIGVRAALQGRRTAVITIDPAKRLATSLGLEELGDRPANITSEIVSAFRKAKAAGMTIPDQFKEPKIGRFDAIMPDARSNFRDFLRDLAPSAEIVERVMSNPIFQIFTKEFSGANEYMALERLQAIDSMREYDCIILDTPPSRNALAFLAAPKLLSQFFDERLIRWLVLPANSLVASGMKKALSILERLTGTGFMTNLFDFASTVFAVRVRFLANLEKTMDLLESPDVGFIMVATPTPETAPEVRHFIDILTKHHFNFDGVAVNRTLGYLDPVPASAKSPKHQRPYEVLTALIAREKKALSGVGSGSTPLCAKLPELARDVHSVEDLFYVAMALDPDYRL